MRAGGEGERKLTVVHPRGRLSAGSIPVVGHSLAHAYRDSVRTTAKRSPNGTVVELPGCCVYCFPFSSGIGAGLQRMRIRTEIDEHRINGGGGEEGGAPS